MSQKSTKKRVGRPALADNPDYQRALRRQAIVFRAIQIESGLSNAQLDELFTGVVSQGNRGKAWRRWVTGQQRCVTFNKVCDLARAKGWLNESAVQALEWADLSAEAWVPIMKRVSKFKSASAALRQAFDRFREVCEAEHNEHGSIEVLDKNMDCYLPASGEELNVMFESAQRQIDKVAGLALSYQIPDLPPEPHPLFRF